jgi:hypothetical protein
MGLAGDIGDRIKDQKDQEEKRDDYEYLFDDEIIPDHSRLQYFLLPIRS